MNISSSQYIKACKTLSLVKTAIFFSKNMGVSQNYSKSKIPFVLPKPIREPKGILNWFLCKNGMHPKILPCV
jgi:hypothetical protein